MASSRVERMTVAACGIASSLGLPVDEAVVLHESNKVALRLLPCDVMARVAPVEDHVGQLELDVARQLVRTGSPVAAPDPRVEARVYERDSFAVTLWTYYAPHHPDDVEAADYADALVRLHAGMRQVDVPTPHFTERVGQALRLVASRDRTPELDDADRDFLGTTLRNLARRIEERSVAQQVLHGEPYPGNVLSTKDGLLFVDLETCCRGPVEFDLAHAPDEVAERYPGVDLALLRDCRLLGLGMVAAWRWDRDDRLPDGRRLGEEWLGQLREGIDSLGPDAPLD
ncbi:aminoglycoside phosphotransferase [Cellulomonas chitinilytica]|uniref:Aminoglycoside phosphotransferase n=1 Tax=Cellulomonas chitinilytica TaxID=398759 RepID=A0A919P0A4_9CELL|nr:phosphotransferase [Cellulomonas chitinilytica]GIG19757.1 aminoglycoside phosphotransferase [Cellulomonas chitinilytica]